MTRRETLLLAAFALWGVVIGFAFAPMWQRPSPAGQLPGFAAQQNVDARALLWFIAALAAFTFVLPFVLRPMARRLAGGERWASNAAIAAVLATAWFVSIAREPLWAIVPCALVIAVSALLRNRPLAFTRRDWILLPVFGTTFLALIDVAQSVAIHKLVLVAAAIVFAIRLAVSHIPSPLPPAYSFVLVPLGLTLQTGFFARDQRYFGWHALALVLITPFVMRFVLRRPPRRLLAFVIYPLAVYSYMNATSVETAEGKPRVNFFEDGYSLPVASEYLRGERPYRDVLPVHGLVEDGLFDFATFRTRGTTAGDALRTRTIAGTLNSVAMYALGAAMVGSAEAGLVTYFFWQLTAATDAIRLTPALFALALIAAAVRRRRLPSPRPRGEGQGEGLLLAAGTLTVVCGLTSLDFAAFTFLVLIVAALRMRAIKTAAIGLAIGVVPLVIALSAFGILGDFVRATFVEIPAMGAAYALPSLPRFQAKFPEIIGAIFTDPASYAIVMWCVVAIATAVLLARPRRRRLEPFVIVGLWIVAAAISFAERHHLYFEAVLPAMMIGAAWIAVRRRFVFSPAIVAAVLMVSMITTHIAVVGWMRRSRGPTEEGWVEVRDLPRAGGAYFRAKDAAQLASARRYVDLTLQPGDTYVDFTNRALLFHLLRRDNPIRYIEVANYESEEHQRAVIAALERNPRVRAALVPPGGESVDGVPNSLRAPLVWQYLQANFHPDFEEGEVVFWRKR